MTSAQFTPALGRSVVLRPDTSDHQVWADTFTGLYHLPPPDMPAPATVLDLGANIGLTAAHYQALWPNAKIVAIEMDEDCANLAALNAPGVEVVCCAVSALGGWGWYDPNVRAEAFQFTPYYAHMEPPTEEQREHVVGSYTLRQIILRHFEHGVAREDLRPVDFVKMDVEGAEWDIFERPTWAPLVRHLVVELHDPDVSPEMSDRLKERALDMLYAAGFDGVQVHPPHPRALYAWRN